MFINTTVESGAAMIGRRPWTQIQHVLGIPALVTSSAPTLAAPRYIPPVLLPAGAGGDSPSHLTENTSTAWARSTNYTSPHPVIGGNDHVGSTTTGVSSLILTDCPIGATCIETMAESCVTFEFVISFVLIGVTCLLGFIGNALSIATLWRDSIKSVTTYLLTMLAIADSAFLFPGVFVIMIPTYCEYFQNCVDPVVNAIPYIEQYGWAVASITHTCTVYVTVLVALHRYYCVCRPHDAQRLSGFRRAKIQVALVPVFAVIYNLPRFLEYRVLLIKVPMENGLTRLETQKKFTSFGDNIWFQVFYKNVAFCLVMYIIPLVMLSYLSVRLAQTLHKRRKNRPRRHYVRHQNKKDDNITLVLIIIIVVFVICQTPTPVQRLILAVSGAKGHVCGHVYFYIEQIGDYMAILNSCINFVIYVLFARHFRQTLLNDVLRSPCSKRTPGSPTSQSREIATYNQSTPPGVTMQVTANGDSRYEVSICTQCKEEEGRIPNGSSQTACIPLLHPGGARCHGNNNRQMLTGPEVELSERTGSTEMPEDSDRGDCHSGSEMSMETPVKIHVTDETDV